MNHSPYAVNGRAEAVRLREEATRLLEQLRLERRSLQQALDEHGRRDQFKSVRGRSALDGAIDATQRLVYAVDRYLEVADVRSRRFATRSASIFAQPAGVGAGAGAR